MMNENDLEKEQQAADEKSVAAKMAAAQPQSKSPGWSLEDSKERHDYQTAVVVSQSKLVPQFAADAATVYAFMKLADELKIPLFQCMYGFRIIQGRPFPTSEFLLARVLAHYGDEASPVFEVKGEGDAVAVRMKLEFTDESTIDGPWVSYAMAVEDGWTRNSKYAKKHMREHMLKMRAISFFARLICPSATFSTTTADEVEGLKLDGGTGAGASKTLDTIGGK